MLSKNHPIKPSIIQTYLAKPLVGIVPNPSVTNEFKLNVSALMRLKAKPAINTKNGFIYPFSFFVLKSLKLEISLPLEVVSHSEGKKKKNMAKARII